MNEERCHNLLNLTQYGNPAVEMTMAGLEAAVVRSIESRLVTKFEKFHEFVGVRLLDEFVLLRNGERLLMLEIAGWENDRYLVVSTDGGRLFRELRTFRLLREVVPEEIVAEFDRLGQVAAADRLARDLNQQEQDLAEYQRLKLKLESEGVI